MDGLAQQAARKTIPGLVQLNDGQWYFQGGAIPEKDAYSMLNVLPAGTTAAPTQQVVTKEDLLSKAYRENEAQQRKGGNLIGAAIDSLLGR